MKQCKNYTEEARVAVRNARRDANTAIEKLKKDSEISEDDAKRAETESQKLTDSYVAQIEDVYKRQSSKSAMPSKLMRGYAPDPICLARCSCDSAG